MDYIHFIGKGLSLYHVYPAHQVALYYIISYLPRGPKAHTLKTMTLLLVTTIDEPPSWTCAIGPYDNGIENISVNYLLVEVSLRPHYHSFAYIFPTPVIIN